MSRRSHQAPREARQKWPALAAFLSDVAHGDDDRRPNDDLEAEVAGRSLEERKIIAREWWDWNRKAAAVSDIRFSVEALDSSILFSEAELARDFMNHMYDRLIVSVRRDGETDWKP